MRPKRYWITSQLTICIVLLILVAGLRLAPDGQFSKTKAGIFAILTTHVDLKTEWERLQSRFQQEKALNVLSPVSDMVAPVSGHILKGFGMQDASEQTFHYGVVLSCKDNENVLAAQNGTVTEIATNSEYGTFILIKHSEAIYTLYGGLGEIFPDVGAEVTIGQPIARADEKNDVYFELRRGDSYLNPAEYITFAENAHD